MGDGVNIATGLEGVAKPGAICLSEDAYRQAKGRLDLAVDDRRQESPPISSTRPFPQSLSRNKARAR